MAWENFGLPEIVGLIKAACVWLGGDPTPLPAGVSENDQ